MSIKSIFGSVFISCLAALILYDMLVKGFIAKTGLSPYDNTFEPKHEPGVIYQDEAGRKYIAA